jgi:hypothetical protein
MPRQKPVLRECISGYDYLLLFRNQSDTSVKVHIVLRDRHGARHTSIECSVMSRGFKSGELRDSVFFPGRSQRSLHGALLHYACTWTKQHAALLSVFFVR